MAADPGDRLASSPTREEFVALAAEHGVVPVWVELLADLDTPLSVFARLRGSGPSFLLESAEHGQRWGRFSFVGIEPFATLHSQHGQVTWTGEILEGLDASAGALAALEAALERLKAPDILDVPLHGGAVGLLGYDVIREVEDIPDTGVDDLDVPDVLMLFPRHVVALDHLRQSMMVITNVVIGDDPGRQYDEAQDAMSGIVDRLGATAPSVPVAPPVVPPAERAPANMTPDDYEQMVDRVKEYILAGDTFQTVVSQRFALDTDVDALNLYRVLRVVNPSPYLFLFDFEDFQVVGSSPEALVQVSGRHVETWPIAGTRPRGATPQEDVALEHELIADAKERAEHVMLVDLARNDLGRVCEIGTVKVSDMMGIERYSHVMHIVSSVTGKLRDGLGPVDVLRAVFPAGTVSGAPKVRAMEIIDELEPTRRGPYAGAVGYLDFSGNLDTCIAIRTVVLKDGVAYVQAGAGIVADSVPANEEEETRNKAGALLGAVRAASQM